MMTAPKYNKNCTQNHPWVPCPVTVQSVKNKSGGTYDIINNKEHTFNKGGPLKLMEKQICNRQKGVVEYNDRQRSTAFNPNWDHLAAIEKEPHGFRRKNGMFTNLYDSAARFGESQVFKA
jgi:hypothetical protein